MLSKLEKMMSFLSARKTTSCHELMPCIAMGEEKARRRREYMHVMKTATREEEKKANGNKEDEGEEAALKKIHGTQGVNLFFFDFRGLG